MSDSSDSDDDFFDARTDLASPQLNLEEPYFKNNESDSPEVEKTVAGSTSDIGSNTSLELHDLFGKDLDDEAKVETDSETKLKDNIFDISSKKESDITKTATVPQPQSNNVLQSDDVTDIVINTEKPKILSPPDIVTSSMKERPKDLPGVQAVKIEPPMTSTTTSSSTITSSSTRSSINRPPRPPPPRPKQPPQRPSLSSKAKSVKSSLDEGLQTPNSTVDNLITKEFAAAVLKDNKEESTISIPTETDEANTVEKATSTLTNVAENNTGADSCPVPPPRSPPTMKKTPTTTTVPASPSMLMDEEILSTVIVRNLDTGQTMPLSEAAEQVSQYLNPLALQIMSRTKEFNCPQQQQQGAGELPPVTVPSSTVPVLPNPKRASLVSQHTQPSTDEDTISNASDEIIKIGGEAPSSSHIGNTTMNMKTWKKRLGKGAKKVKSVTSTQMGRAIERVKSTKLGDVSSLTGARDESLHVSSDEEVSEFSSSFKIKQASSHKGPYHFNKLKLVQDIAVHVGAVWSMKFSHCGKLLATAGQNNIIWVWVLKKHFNEFNDLRNKYDGKDRGAVFATPPRSSMDFHDRRSFYSDVTKTEDEDDDEEDAPFRSLPFSSYVGHTADVLDLAWSKNYFTLSSSMDKTVRLWHVSQKECLCCFQHIDFVTAIAFHPKDDRYFLSGSLDGKLRLWNIPDKKVALWNEVTPDSSGNQISNSGISLITSVNFCENGKFAVCGTYDGRCLFYDTEHLKYHTQIHVRSSRRRNNKGHKITGIEALHGEHKILVTSNDSRVRLYDLRDLSLSCKYKGLTNTSSQIKASFSHDCKYIICGSEDKSIYIWRTQLPQDAAKISSLRRDRNEQWESVRGHDAVVTCAIFAPFPHLVDNVSSLGDSKVGKKDEPCVIISADFSGVIKVFMNG